MKTLLLSQNLHKTNQKKLQIATQHKVQDFLKDAAFYRHFWTTGFILVQGNVLAPFTLLNMQICNGGMWQLVAMTICFFMVLVSILSVQPMKWIFGLFGISVLVHIFIVTSNLLH
jgi:hypothetical protein